MAELALWKDKAAMYKGFQTSAAILKRTMWQVETDWETLDDEEAAKKFIGTSPPRDNRNLMGKSRFRLLLVHYSDVQNQLYKQGELLEVAQTHGWISDRFKFLIENQTGGASVSESADNIGFAVQTPTDDGDPFFGLSVTEQHGPHGRRHEADWVGILFIGRGLSPETVESLLRKDPFPPDFEPPVDPDLMFTPVALLQWQVEEITRGLGEIRKQILDHDQKLVKVGTGDLTERRNSLYWTRQRHLRLHRRRLFTLDFAAKLNRCFEKLEGDSHSGSGYPVPYSPTLRYRVEAATADLATIVSDLDAIPSRLDAQQTALDNQMSIILAKNSEIAAEEARRDSTSMRTIAVVTLVFLPGTFVAAMFSMSIFNWQADKGQGQQVVSGWIWLYFAITGGLTLTVMAIWTVWFTYANRRYYQERAVKME